MDQIPVVVYHAKLTEAELETELDYDHIEDWEKSLPRHVVPRKEFIDYLERLSRKTERLRTPAERVDLIVSFKHWPEFVTVEIYDGYVE